MDFVIERDVLADAVSRIIAVCERPSAEGKNTLPHLFHIRIDGYGKALKLSAGNSIRSVEILLTEVTHHDPFCFGITGDYFNQLLKAMPSCKLSFSLRDMCYMHNGSSTLKFAILGPESFPSATPRGDHSWQEVDYKELFSRFKKISYCVYKQDLIDKNYVKCICMFEDSFICTDHKRMSVIPNGIVKCEIPALIPSESIQAFSSLFAGSEAKAFVHVGEKFLALSQDKVYASTRLSVWDAPNLSRVIPGGGYSLCEADRGTMLLAIKRAIIVSQRGKGSQTEADLIFSDGKVHLSLDNQGISIAENITVKYDGPYLNICLTLAYLYQAIKSVADETLFIELRGDTVPIVITDREGRHKNIIVPRIRGMI